jgi:CDP-diacylglycerol--glycerol-3-phosphate 3-phosphatidyltransferase
MLDHIQEWVRIPMRPLARGLDRIGCKPDYITIGGTVITVLLAFLLLPAGHVLVGGILIGIFALFDTLDGTLARLQGSTGPWGAFLDATMDRITDGAVFGAIVMWFVFDPADLLVDNDGFRLWGVLVTLWCLALGAVVPYAHARAEAVGASARVGLTGRADRLVIALVPLGFTQVGLPVLVLLICLSVLALTTLITVAMRIVVVHRQLTARKNDEAAAEAPEGDQDA